MTTIINIVHLIALACAGIGMVAMTAANPVFGQTAAANANGGTAEGSTPGAEKLSFSDRILSTYQDYLNWNGDPVDAPQT